MNGDDHFIKPDNDVSSSDIAHALRKLYRGQPLIDQAADAMDRLKTNVRHWREECGKLHAQVLKLKGDLEAWEITAKRLEEAQIAEFAERSTADVLYWKGQAEAANIALAKVRKVRDGYADQAKFADVDPASYFREFVRRLDSACMAGVAEQSGAGAPETSVRCGAPAAAVSDMTKDRA